LRIGEGGSMKIAYVILPEEKASRLESRGAGFLREDYGLDVEGYEYVVVYVSREGRVNYHKAFKVIKKGNDILLEPSKKPPKRPVDEIHKYWARKPWWAVSQYILTYSKEGDVICDPMCGSGIIGYEALRTRRRAILVDLNPFAVFLARNTIRPLESKKLLSAFEEVLNRPIDRDIITEDKEILIPKGTPVKEALRYLYKTTCRSCKKEAETLYYVWDTIYQYNGRKPSNEEEAILLEAIAHIRGDGQNPPKEVSQLFLLENWKQVLEKARELCEVRGVSNKKILGEPPRPSTITDVFGKLVREGVYTRARREPRFLYYECKENKKHKGIAELIEDDRKLISKLSKVIIPFPYPKTLFKYPNGKLFDTARPDSVFIPDEALSTWTQEEMKNNDEKVHHLFTKRNLLALSILFWSIEQVKDQDIREKLLLAFTSTSLHCSKLISSQLVVQEEKWKKVGGALWMTNRYSVPPDFKEANCLLTFEEEFTKIYDANEEALQEIGDYYREAKSPGDFVNDPSFSVLLLRMDARELGKIFEKYRDVVDMVFTDPPYGDAIQYFELSTFWVSWLLLDPDWAKTYGDGDWWQKEVVVNPVQGKSSLELFKRDITEVFRSVANITKSNATWVVTYHKREPRYWNALIEAQISIGLGLYSEERHELLGKSFNPSKDFRFLETDAYTVWRRLSAQRIRNLEEAAKLFFDIISPAIHQGNGILSRDAIEKAYIEMAWSVEKGVYERFFEGKLDSFLSKCTIQIPTKDSVLFIIRRDSPPSSVSLEKWQELWNRCYANVNRELLIKTALYEYIRGRTERNQKVCLDDIYRDIINRIDGQITKDMVFKALKEVAEYDWLEGTYKPKQVVPGKTPTLLKWMTPKRELKLPDPPENLIPKIALELIKKDFEVYIGEGYDIPDLSPVYRRKVLKRIESLFKAFPLVLQKQQKKVCIDINTISRASQVLLRKDAQVIILLGSENAQKDWENYFKTYINEGRLILINVKGLTTDEVIGRILKYVGGK
jgi:16S rRNA G966 N2-methylase RsmD